MRRGQVDGGAAYSQSGAVATELVVVTPVLLLLVMVVVQFALWEHAGQIAQAAAQRGAETARIEHGTDSQGLATAQAALSQLGGRLLVDPQVTVSRSGGVVTVSVSGAAEAVVPFLNLAVHATVAGPVERFAPPAAPTP